MDFLLGALEEIAAEIFYSVAHLLNLDVDIVFVDTTSTYWEMEVAADLAETAAEDGGDDDSLPEQAGARLFGHSKDHRDDLPQVVIAMAVTRDGIPVRCWTFPGDTGDQKIIRKVKDDLGGWNLRRLVWVADRGFASAANRAYLARGGGHYIHAEKLRGTNAEAAAALARQGRYRTVAGNLRVKEVWVPARDAGERAERFVVCHNPEQALAGPAGPRAAGHPPRRADRRLGCLDPAQARRARRLAEGQAGAAPVPAPHSRAGCCASTTAAIRREADLDGKWLLRTNDETLTPDDLAAAYKQLIAVERGWRDMKGALKLRPVYHYREDRIRAHVQLCWLALLLIRVAETATSDTWRNLRHELDRMHLVTLATADGRVAQRSAATPGQQAILHALDLPEPPKFFDFTIEAETAG